jgi:hypothetical protein
VADAVVVEPVSASNFPASREINREFYQFCPYLQSALLDSRNDFDGLRRNSPLIRTGNIFQRTGNLQRNNKDFKARHERIWKRPIGR